VITIAGDTPATTVFASCKVQRGQRYSYPRPLALAGPATFRILIFLRANKIGDQARRVSARIFDASSIRGAALGRRTADCLRIRARFGHCNHDIHQNLSRLHGAFCKTAGLQSSNRIAIGILPNSSTSGGTHTAIDSVFERNIESGPIQRPSARRNNLLCFQCSDGFHRDEPIRLQSPVGMMSARLDHQMTVVGASVR